MGPVIGRDIRGKMLGWLRGLASKHTVRQEMFIKRFAKLLDMMLRDVTTRQPLFAKNFSHHLDLKEIH